MKHLSNLQILGKAPQVHVHVLLEGERILSVLLSLKSDFSSLIEGGTKDAQKKVLSWLKAYAQRKESLLPSLSLLSLTSFQKKTLREIAKIPFGQTLSYRQVGEASGMKAGWRAIGGACKKNPIPLFIPCHRVISSNGELGGFALDLEIKKRLLEFEKS